MERGFDSLNIEADIVKCTCGEVVRKFIITDLTNEFEEYRIDKKLNIFKMKRKFINTPKEEKKKFPFRILSKRELGWIKINLTDTLRADISCKKCFEICGKVVLVFVMGELIFWALE